jgi:hypothetical protein
MIIYVDIVGIVGNASKSIIENQIPDDLHKIIKILGVVKKFTGGEGAISKRKQRRYSNDLACDRFPGRIPVTGTEPLPASDRSLKSHVVFH